MFLLEMWLLLTFAKMWWHFAVGLRVHGESWHDYKSSKHCHYPAISIVIIITVLIVIFIIISAGQSWARERGDQRRSLRRHCFPPTGSPSSSSLSDACLIMLSSATTIMILITYTVSANPGRSVGRLSRVHPTVGSASNLWLPHVSIPHTQTQVWSWCFLSIMMKNMSTFYCSMFQYYGL